MVDKSIVITASGCYILLMFYKNNKGFTLIELLVVVAIIGILSAVVLFSLGDSRTKSNNSSVKANLSTARKQIELYYLNNNENYGSVPFGQATCPAYNAAATNAFASDQTINRAIVEAVSRGGNGSSCVSINTPSNAYAVAVGLKTFGQSWCIDSAGKSKQFAGTPAAAITAVTASCN